MNSMRENREFDFGADHFNALRQLVHTHTGISLSDAKEELVYSRLARRLRRLRMTNFDDYLRFLEEQPDDEMGNFVNAVTTNLTSFFREKHHFEHLSGKLLPSLLESRKKERRLRIWSAGCSTGQEPYSLSMILNESIPDIKRWDIKILATDIDTDVLNKAKEGVYEKSKSDGISSSRLQRWFLTDESNGTEIIKVRPELKNLITFKQLNLLSDWPMKGPFDVLFCRNVVIYFDKDTQRILFERFANILSHDGNMYIGHSETLFKISDRFELLGKTIYRKIP